MLVKRLLGHGLEATPGRESGRFRHRSHRRPPPNGALTSDMNVPVILFRKSQRFDSVGTLGACSPDRLVGDHAVEARVEGDLDDITIWIDDLYRHVIWLIGPLVFEPDSGFRHD